MEGINARVTLVSRLVQSAAMGLLAEMEVAHPANMPRPDSGWGRWGVFLTGPLGGEPKAKRTGGLAKGSAGHLSARTTSNQPPNPFWVQLPNTPMIAWLSLSLGII